MPVAAWLVVPLAYLLGGLSPGYWLVRWKTGGDLRTQGSGATGATNAARVLGRGGFATVLALDVAKGACAVFAARLAGLAVGGQSAAAAAIVAGHIWPLQLGFRGGRGLGPLLGAWLVLAPLAIGACLVFTGLIWAVLRQRVTAAMIGALLLPAATWFEKESAGAVACTAFTAVCVLIAHRSHWASPPPSS